MVRIVLVIAEISVPSVQLGVGVDIEHQVPKVGLAVHFNALEVLLEQRTGRQLFLLDDRLGVADEQPAETLADPTCGSGDGVRGRGGDGTRGRDGIPRQVRAGLRDAVPIAPDAVPTAPCTALAACEVLQHRRLVLHPHQQVEVVGQQRIAVGIEHWREVVLALAQKIRVIALLVEDVRPRIATVENVVTAAGQHRGV